jgi:hypothetical protein
LLRLRHRPVESSNSDQNLQLNLQPHLRNSAVPGKSAINMIVLVCLE